MPDYGFTFGHTIEVDSNWAALLVIGIVVTVLAVVMCTGHGAQLVAGLNGKSRSAREAMGAAAITRIVGQTLLPIGILLPILGFEELHPWSVLVYLAMTMALVAVCTARINRLPEPAPVRATLWRVED